MADTEILTEEENKKRQPWQVFYQSVQDWQMPDRPDRPHHEDSFAEAQKFFDLVPAGKILQITQGINILGEDAHGMRHAHTYFFMNVPDQNGALRPVLGVYDDERKLPEKAFVEETKTKLSEIQFRTSRILAIYGNANGYYFDQKSQDIRPVLNAVIIDPETGQKEKMPTDTVINATDIGKEMRANYSSVLLFAGVSVDNVPVIQRAEQLGAGIDIWDQYETEAINLAITSKSHKAFDHIVAHEKFKPHQINDKHLRMAAAGGDLEMFEKIYDRQRYGIDAVSEQGKNALMIAAEKGNVEIVEFLLDKGTINPEYINYAEQNCLDLAVAAEQAETVDLLLKRTNIDPQSALIGAAEIGNLEIFNMLRHDPRSRPATALNADGDNALIAACYGQKPEHKQIASIILDDADMGLDPGFRTILSKTALEGAIRQNRPMLVEKLLEHPDVSPNGTTDVGVPYLAEVVNRKNLALVDTFLNCPRTDPNIKGRDGIPVLSYAVHHEQTDIVRRFLAHPDTDPAIESPLGRSPLELAKTAEMRDMLEQKIATRQTVTPLSHWRQQDNRLEFGYRGQRYSVTFDK